MACQSFGECTARVKLELTDFSEWAGCTRNLGFQLILLQAKGEDYAHHIASLKFDISYLGGLYFHLLKLKFYNGRLISAQSFRTNILQHCQ